MEATNRKPVSSPARRRMAVTLATTIAGVAVWIVAGTAAGRLRASEREAKIISGERGRGEAIASALGGFRGLAADFLWLRTIQMQDEGRFDEITLLCEMILAMQPRFASVWTFLSWNFAYNLAFEATTPAERWHWIRRGFDLLEKDGVRRNENSRAILWEIGYMYYFRVTSKGHDAFFRYYDEKIAPVPQWCAEDFEFVNGSGLWSSDGVRYRLYRKAVSPGRITLGGAQGPGGRPSRARRMYFVAVNPAEALSGARRRSGEASVSVEPVPLEPGAPLCLDGPGRVGPDGRHRTAFIWEPPEPTIPSALRGAALLPLPDADRMFTGDDYLELELDRPAEVWVGWLPDEARSFEIAREWLLKAENLSGEAELRVSRLRVQCLVQIGERLLSAGDREGAEAQWELAYEEFKELRAVVPPGQTSVRFALENFLVFAIYKGFEAGDRRSIEKWYGRLRAAFPWWTMPPDETAADVAKMRELPWPPER